MVPKIVIVIFALSGLAFWEFKGLILGGIVGYILVVLFGLSLFPIMKSMDKGLIKKEFRIAVARDFINRNEEDIFKLNLSKNKDKDEIIDIFSRYINEIQDEIIKLPNPVKRDSGDLEYCIYRSNFIPGGKQWINKNFANEKEIDLMQKFVIFCEVAIYENFSIYGSVYEKLSLEELLRSQNEMGAIWICPKCREELFWSFNKREKGEPTCPSCKSGMITVIAMRDQNKEINKERL